MLSTTNFTTNISLSDDELTKKKNITAKCNIPPPHSSQCARIPICGPYDYNHSASVCRPELSISSCIAGFMYVNPSNVILKPPKNVMNLNQLPAASTSSDAKCYEKDGWQYTRACCPGFYCPADQYCMVECDVAGSYCPSSDTLTFPHCEELFDVTNLTQTPQQYPLEMGCGGAWQKTTLCPSGHYCSNSSEKHTCKEGTYCRAGYSEERSCGGMIVMHCPENTDAPYVNIWLTSIIIGAVLGIFFLKEAFSYFKTKKGVPNRVESSNKNAINAPAQNGNGNAYDYQNSNTMFANNQSLTPVPNIGSINSSHRTYNNMSSHDDQKDYSKSRTGFNNIHASFQSEHSMRKHRFRTFSESYGVMPKKSKQPFPDGKIPKGKQLKFHIDLEFKNLSLVLKSSGKKILDECYGHFRAGTVNAIMGPSGAGKSTLLNTLSGKASAYGNISGDIMINGEKKNIHHFKDIMGFVPQSDAMTAEMTVEEMLMFNAKFRLSADVSDEYRRNVVNDVLEILKISHIRHSKIGDDFTRGISGGQQKRVNIGMELVAQPSILFLDEPTSGLDATTANDLMEVLQLIAKCGTLVLVVLHQPRYEIFAQFDNLLLLMPGGRTVYNAQTSKSMTYFQSLGYQKAKMVNPADFLMDVISGMVENKYGDRVIDFPAKWKSTAHKKSAEYCLKINKNFIFEKDNSKYKPRKKMNFITQTAMCAKRDFSIMFRQKWQIIIDVILILLCGFVVGFIVDPIHIDMVPSNIDFTVMGSSVVGAIISLRIFGNDRLMYWRFASVGINRLSYYLGGCVAGFMWCFITPLLFLCVWWINAMPQAGFLDYYFILTLGMFIVQGIGHAVSVASDPNKAVLVAVVITLIWNFLNGFQPTLVSLNSSFLGKFITTTCYSRWQQEALFGIEIGAWNDVYGSERDYQHTYYGWKSGEEHLKIDIIMLVGLGLALRLTTFLFLVFLNKARQL